MKLRATNRAVALAVVCATTLSSRPSLSEAQGDEISEEQLREQAEREDRAGNMLYSDREPGLPRRELPDYTGRDGNRKTFARGLLWVPRTIFFPLYFLTEYVIRAGLGSAATRMEEKHIPAKVRDAFRFGPNNDYMLYPVFTIDLGLRATVGIQGRFRNVPVDDTTLRFSGNFGGRNLAAGTIGIDWKPKGKNWSGSIDAGLARFDDLFFGIGSEASDDNQTSYSVAGYEARVSYNVSPWERGGIALRTGYRFRDFGGTGIPELAMEGKISELPAGFPEGYSAWFLNNRVTFDSRRPRPEPQSGVRIGTGFDLGLDPARGATQDIWISYGAAVRGFLDVSGHNHTFSLAAIVLFSDGLRGEVPFTELPVISGSGPMPGFVGRFLTGESAAVLNFQFTWPIWLMLDGKLHFAVGNVFDGHLSNFAGDQLRMSFGGGMQAHSGDRIVFELMVGGGSETFANGANITSFRFLFGVTSDF